MKSFEEMFGVCPEHRLVLVKSRSVGGDIPIERWDHEEFDHRGSLVARYETFVEIGSGDGDCPQRLVSV